MKNDKTNQEFEYEFTNPYTKKKENYSYRLTLEELAEAIVVYADFYNVSLDGTSGHIVELFATLDSGRYEHLNEVLEKIVEDDYVLNHMHDKLKAKAEEEFLEEKQEEYEAELD